MTRHRLALRRLGFDGREAAEPIVVNNEPPESFLDELRVVRMGPRDLAVSWWRRRFPEGMFLARVRL